MNIDVNTLIIVLGILCILQILVYSMVYYLYKNRVVSRYCILWSVFSVAVYFLIEFRRFWPSRNPDLVMLFANIILFLAQLFLYFGILGFRGRRFNRFVVIFVCLVFGAITLYSIYGAHDGNLRAISLYLAISVISFLSAFALWQYRAPPIRVPAILLAASFSLQGFFFFLRVVLALLSFPIKNPFSSETLQAMLFLVQIVTGFLWSFGFVIMIGLQASAKNDEYLKTLKLMFNANPDAVWLIRMSDTLIIDVNRGFTMLTGYRHDEAVGKTTLELGLWNDPAARERLVRMMNAAGICRNYEIEYVRKDGRKRIGILSSSLTMMDGVSHAVTSLHDISGRKRMEDRLHRSEEKFRMLVENSHDIIYTLAADGTCTFMSPVWTRLLGHATSEVIGKSFREFVHPDDLAACEIFLETVIATGERRSGIEYRLRSKDGKWFWHTTSAVPFRDETGKVVGFYGISSDVGERRKFLEDLEKKATTDELTGVINRRYFIELATAEVKRALRFAHPLSFALIDIDHFKQINDTWGHAAGDRALMHFARVVRENIREIDILCRFGGDEFVLLLPETDSAAACPILERLRAILADTPLEFDGVMIPVSVSVGVAICNVAENSDDSLDAILGRADKALYQAKENGRDRVSVF
jgi:diguanylate cyclase (GGDEF)-like protein/PAS domain S-box-containing protein